MVRERSCCVVQHTAMHIVLVLKIGNAEHVTTDLVVPLTVATLPCDDLGYLNPLANLWSDRQSTE